MREYKGGRDRKINSQIDEWRERKREKESILK